MTINLNEIKCIIYEREREREMGERKRWVRERDEMRRA